MLCPKAVRYFKRTWSERRIAEQLGVSGPTVHGWKVAWKEKGVKGLYAGHYGRVSRLSREDERMLRCNILKGASEYGFSGGFWTLKRLTIGVKRWSGITYEDRSIWHVLHRLGFLCQKPIKRARERDDKAIRTWMTKTWPEVKKGASNAA